VQPILQITTTEVDALDQLRLTEVLKSLLRAEARGRVLLRPRHVDVLHLVP
jgi:hypothetical protein